MKEKRARHWKQGKYLMSRLALFQWSERLIIVLAGGALVMTLVSFPGAAFTGWLMLATGFFAVCKVVATALMQWQNGRRVVENFLFGNTNAASLWLVIRIYLGSIWLQAGMKKLFDPGWTRSGSALKAFWAGAVGVTPHAHSQIPYPWYRDLLQFMLASHTYAWFAWVITMSEISVGLLLILGLCTGLAAFMGGGLNLLYLTAGSIGINPVMLILSLFLLLAWRVAGYYSLDRVLLPAITRHLFAHPSTLQCMPSIAVQLKIPSLVLDTPHEFE
jgi:thiosulfate dehydrogenase [quinone] large subunit